MPRWAIEALDAGASMELDEAAF
ncbi:hypothetical protein MHPYR_60171 [uncultured Mycobacterium sp.]|uniref:Uncharacterized protein n=1 Tax=uncultured Mycobacterium sp. TaxID=171292 RepID=A0A1Y5PJ23_9MYCO|nr:hypothetical protein MHPYR_60171 [uncultured Mycobacterium sp.]